jgi:hypothetical protein
MTHTSLDSYPLRDRSLRSFAQVRSATLQSSRKDTARGVVPWWIACVELTPAMFLGTQPRQSP